jgi:hypothetical protein
MSRTKVADRPLSGRYNPYRRIKQPPTCRMHNHPSEDAAEQPDFVVR